MLTVESVLLTIKSVSDAVTELAKLAQTEEGRKFLNQALADRAAWDKMWAEAGLGIKRFFSGDLFKE